MNKFFSFIMITAFFLVGVPWIVDFFVKGNNYDLALKLIFFVLNPLYAAAVGISAGKNVKIRWLMCILPPAMFMGCIWLLFDFNDHKYRYYAAVYLVIEIVFMVISWAIRKKQKNRKSSAA